MCNPRQIQVQATRRLAEAWDHEVRRQVNLQGTAVGRAAVRERLAGNVGAPVLAALEHVLANLDDWRETDDGFRHDLDNGYVLYRPDTGELEIVAELAADVDATGTAIATVRAAVDEELTADGSARYYDDEWGGYTEERARGLAGENAQRALDEAASERRAQAGAVAAAAVEDDVAGRAAREAEETLRRLTTDRGIQLERAAAELLAETGVQARIAFNQALAQAYRDALLAYARSRRAQNLRTSRNGGVLSVQFEMEV
jgi:hypothetical protein